jgi:hypothetical protein
MGDAGQENNGDGGGHSLGAGGAGDDDDKEDDQANTVNNVNNVSNQQYNEYTSNCAHTNMWAPLYPENWGQLPMYSLGHAEKTADDGWKRVGNKDSKVRRPINAIFQAGEWVRIEAVVDSGSVVTVAKKSVVKDVTATKASKAGEGTEKREKGEEKRGRCSRGNVTTAGR